MTHIRTRIVTFMDHISLTESPKIALTLGSVVVPYAGKERVFVVRRVFYDDNMTPMYSEPTFGEVFYKSKEDALKGNPRLKDYPILERDNYLRIFNG